jgi:hypothetical protein
MVNHVGSLFPKCCQTFNGKPIVNFTPMPSCVPTSIHPLIIPIPPSLLQLVPSSSIGPLVLFLPCRPHPIEVSPTFVVWSFLP